MKKILIKRTDNKDSIKKALLYAISISEQEKKSISIIVPNLNVLNGDIEEVLGRKLINKIKKGHEKLNKDTYINILTDKTMERGKKYPILVCLFTSKSTMDKINNFYGIDYEIYVNWLDKEIDYYRQWNPIEI